MLFAVHERATGRSIGSSGLHHIDSASGTASMSLVIGATDVWGRGYGTETVRVTLTYASTWLRSRRAELHVAATNERAIRAYRRAGFRVVEPGLNVKPTAHDHAQVIMVCEL